MGNIKKFGSASVPDKPNPQVQSNLSKSLINYPSNGFGLLY